MNNLNSILLDGNLADDPIRSEFPSGTVIAKFTVASNRYYRVGNEQREEVNFIDVETYAKSAERCLDNLVKGRAVRVVGRLKQDTWTDENGTYREKVKIVADHVDLGPMPQKDRDNHKPQQTAPSEHEETERRR